MDNRISISSLDTPQQIFVFACMDEPLLTRMAETFPEWRSLINPIRVQKRYLSEFLADLKFVLLRMSRGETVQDTEKRLGDAEAAISERLGNAFSKLTRPEIPYNPEIPPMTYDFIEEYVEAARAVMEAASIQARTVYRRERELIATAYGFRVGKILETLIGDESEAYQNRSAAYMEIERAIRFVLERMLPRETFAGFRARNSAAAEACSIVASLVENQHNVRPWINRFNLEGMDIECFDLLLRRLQVEKWESDVLEDLIMAAGHEEDL